MDEISGEDINSGLEEASAVKSFGAVKNILESNKNIDTINVTTNETWELPEGVVIKRKVNNENLISVASNAKLT